MPLKNGTPNPLNWLGLRQVLFPAQHFHYTEVAYSPRIMGELEDWIRENLNGRFYIGQAINLTPGDNTLSYTIKIGFEEKKELSFFLISNSIL